MQPLLNYSVNSEKLLQDVCMFVALHTSLPGSYVCMRGPLCSQERFALGLRLGQNFCPNESCSCEAVHSPGNRGPRTTQTHRCKLVCCSRVVAAICFQVIAETCHTGRKAALTLCTVVLTTDLAAERP